MKKRLFFCLLFLFPMLDFAQCPQSDSLFSKGVQLYYKGDYRNAANCFLQTDKMDKLVLDTLSERAQYSKMWLASCYYKMGNIVEAKKYNDAATCFLMTEFYRHWIGGESKHRALQLAKDAVKGQKEKGWDDPKYLAAFILLDGLDNRNN